MIRIIVTKTVTLIQIIMYIQGNEKKIKKILQFSLSYLLSTSKRMHGMNQTEADTE